MNMLAVLFAGFYTLGVGWLILNYGDVGFVLAVLSLFALVGICLCGGKE